MVNALALSPVSEALKGRRHYASKFKFRQVKAGGCQRAEFTMDAWDY